MARNAHTPISYVLREPNSKTPTPIIGIVRFNNDRVKIATGFKVLPLHWNAEKSRIKNVLDAHNRVEVNTYLNELEEEVGKIIVELKTSRQLLSKEIIKERIDNFLNPIQIENKSQSLIDFVRWYIETCPSRLVRSRGNKAGRVLSPDTIRRYKTTLNGLEAFALIYSRSLDFDSIDNQFYQAFTEWLTIKRNYSTNNVSKYIENLKGFMNVAVDEGYTTNLAFLKFPNMREDAENIYLTEPELQTIYDLDLSGNSRLERVRDLFIFAAWTGLRFSDYSTIQPEHVKTDVNGDKYLSLVQQKTHIRVLIPIFHNAVIKLLQKYDNHLPNGISNQKTNDYLKEICKLAGINNTEFKHLTKGGKEAIKISKGYSNDTSIGIEKWELVATHTARRSFATNLYKRGVPTLSIMKLTGHKKESEFLKYIKVDAEENMTLVRSYFQNHIA